ncbi:MAG: efflux RND transporter periplasmic adaptor subunit [Chloroflexota bacterium]
MRRVLIIVVIIAVVASVGFVAYQRYVANNPEAASGFPGAPAQQVASEEEPAFETVEVRRGTIASSVSGTGSIEPAEEISLAFRGTGRIDRVLVTAGEYVTRDQLLAELDTTDLALALAQAMVSMEISEAQLAKLEIPPDADDVAALQAAIVVAQASVASAEASLASAQASYRDLLAGPTEQERLVNRAQVAQAEAQLRTAQQAYDQVKSRPEIGTLPQSTQLQQATLSLEVAQTQAAIQDLPADEAQVAASLNQIAQAELGVRQAQSNLISAQKNLKDLLEGTAAEDLIISRAQLRQAQLSQLQAENNLNNARLIAPFDGVISRVNIQANEFASGGAAVTLTDLDSFQMKVLVDEIDVRQVQVGQDVSISVDAFGDRELTGKVTKVAPTAEDVNGVIAYEVTIVPDQTDVPLRSGMSATAIITTARVDDVLLVPNRYIQLDRQNDQAFVNKLVNGEPALQEIELGMRNEQESQVLAGLDTGDIVALILTSSEEQLRGALFGGPDDE